MRQCSWLHVTTLPKKLRFAKIPPLRLPDAAPHGPPSLSAKTSLAKAGARTSVYDHLLAFYSFPRHHECDLSPHPTRWIMSIVALVDPRLPWR